MQPLSVPFRQGKQRVDVQVACQVPSHLDSLWSFGFINRIVAAFARACAAN
jgi:hypothetical protein